MKRAVKMSALALFALSASTASLAAQKDRVRPFAHQASPSMVSTPETFGRNDNRVVVNFSAPSQGMAHASTPKTFGKRDNRVRIMNEGPASSGGVHNVGASEAQPTFQ